MKKVALAAVGALAIMLVALPAAQAAPFTGLVSPTIQGGLADLNGSGTITTGDSWVDFYGDTDVISGGLDCDVWGNVENDGSDGDNTINSDDDCILIGVDGTADGVTIVVTNGSFSTADGAAIGNGFKLPTVFNATSPTNTSVAAADFAWQTINGRVDANGNNVIDDDDCSVNIVNGYDILGVDCGFAPPTASVDNGKIDVNGDHVITVADDATGTFFGRDIADGLVQDNVVAGPVTVTSFSPTSGPVGTIVTITGTGFAAGAVVSFNGVAATTVTDITATSLKATVPTGATDGPIKVTVGANSGTSATSFDVTGGGGGGGDCTIVGTSGLDSLTGTEGADVICGKAGSDSIRAKQGDDTLRGAKGADLLKGGKGNDLLKGGKGADTLNGGAGFDTCKGGKGPDTLINCEA